MSSLWEIKSYYCDDDYIIMIIIYENYNIIIIIIILIILNIYISNLIKLVLIKHILKIKSSLLNNSV